MKTEYIVRVTKNKNNKAVTNERTYPTQAIAKHAALDAAINLTGGVEFETQLSIMSIVVIKQEKTEKSVEVVFDAKLL